MPETTAATMPTTTTTPAQPADPAAQAGEGLAPGPAISVDDLLGVIRARPGIHFRALARASGQRSSGALRGQLDSLTTLGQVIEVPDGRFKRFFVVGGHDPDLSATIARFSREVPLTIGKLLLVQPLNRTQLRRLVGCADSTLGYHLSRMVKSGDVERTGTRTGGHYRIRDEERVRRTVEHLATQDPHQPANLLRPGRPSALQPAHAPVAAATPPRDEPRDLLA